MESKQLLLGLVANLGTVSGGMTLGFSAVALPQMMNSENSFMNEDQASWMASLASLSTAIGCLITGSIMDRFGRRSAILFLNFPCLLGWLLIALADGEATLGMIYAGRILTGLATGMTSSPPPVYCAEISSGKIRGMMCTWASIGISLGVLIIYALGTWFPEDWKLIAGLSAVLPVACIILVYFFLHESPAWLTSQGRYDEAAEVMQKLQKDSEPIKPKIPTEQPKINLWKAFFSSATLYPFLILNIYFLFQQFSGTYVIIFYAVDFVKEAGITFDPYLITILIGLLRLVLTVVVGVVSSRFGRRPPSIVSGAGMTLCMGSLATFVYLSSTGGITQETVDAWSLFPVIALLLYILTGTIGFMTLPWAMIGEVFPAKVRGVAAGLTTFFAYMFNFLIVKLYPYMLHTLDRYGLFFFYGGVSVLGTIFVVIFLPETKNNNLDDIDQGKNKDVVDYEEQRPLHEGNSSSVVIIPAQR